MQAFSMWQRKQPVVEMKTEDFRKHQKRKFEGERGTETESEALEQGPKRKCQDGAETIFKEPGKAQKKTPQEHQDTELQREHPGKGQVQKPQEGSPRKLTPMECTKGPPEQAVTEKRPPDGCKGHKRPYSILEENEQSPQKEKCGRFSALQHHVRSDTQRPHTILTNTLKNKGGVPGHSYGSERDQEPSTAVAIKECLSPEKRLSEEKSVTQKKGGTNLEGRRGNSLEPDFLGTQAQILDCGGDRLPANKMTVLAAGKTPRIVQEKCRVVDQILDLTEDMEEEIKNALGPRSQEEILSCKSAEEISRH